MITVWSVAAGLVWGTLFGLIGARVTKKMANGSEREISSMSLVRTVMDVIALAAVYFTRNLLPLRFEVTLVSTAVALTLIGIVAAFRIAARMKK